MKTNMKKLAMFLFVFSITMLLAVATASADRQKYRKTLHGEYAFTGSGACTLAPTGFEPNFTPTNPEFAGMGPNVWEGVYTFNHNGKGKMETRQCYNEGPPSYSSGCADLSWEFEYELDGGAITFTFMPYTYYLKYTEGPNDGLTIKLPSLTEVNQPWTGRISPDGRNLFVFYGGPFKIEIKDFKFAPNLEIICNAVHQGFRTK